MKLDLSEKAQKKDLTKIAKSVQGLLYRHIANAKTVKTGFR